ncbi:hypothetical protein ACSQ6I_26320 [Anabaena sp. WFMT]|uniref:hypothetical protein n=1 Tax=Anabaena sp. WFMT TaxID=3449730 RepID=UPI003F296AB9
MSSINPKHHTVTEAGVIILHSNHLGDIVEVHINKEKRRFYGILEDNKTEIEDDKDCGNDFAQPVMLYKIKYFFEREPKDTWEVGYRIKGKSEDTWMKGFKTAREAWLYREALIAANVAER